MSTPTGDSTAVAVVVAAHGSRAAAANDAHHRVVAGLGERSGRTVLAAFLELVEPSIPDAIDAAVAGGASTVLVVPYFLHPGRHSTEDIPAIVADARERHPAADLRLLDLFGADPALVDLLAAQVGAALDPAGS